MAIYTPQSCAEFKKDHLKIKTFSETSENDTLYLIDIDKSYNALPVSYSGTLIKENVSYNRYEMNKIHKMYPEFKTDENYEYDEIIITVVTPDNKTIRFDTFDNASFVFDFGHNYILCACNNSADFIIDVLMAKCTIQAYKFKAIFNGKL